MIDARYARPGSEAHLLVRVLHSGPVREDAVTLKTQIVEECRRYAGHRRARLALAPYGSQHQEAASTIRTWLTTSTTALPWIAGARDAKELRDAVIAWLEVIVTYHRNAATPQPGQRRAVILDDELSSGNLGHSTARPFGGGS